MSRTAACFLVASGLSLAPRVAAAEPFQTTVALALERWIDIGYRDGPVTIHRLRLERKNRGFKATVSRPGNAEFLQDVQIQIEYSNNSSTDWQVDADIVWLDAGDKMIDGYRGDKDLDEDGSHEIATLLLAALKYGLDQARRLRIRLTVGPD
jgi:hypothetical protein